MAIIGIDLGTTNSLAYVCCDGKPTQIPNPLGQTLTPSVVSIDDDGKILVGAIARERLISHPTASAASFKRYMGTNKVFFLDGQTFTPQELSSFILRQLFRNQDVCCRCSGSVLLGRADPYPLAGKVAGSIILHLLSQSQNFPSSSIDNIFQQRSYFWRFV